jgi:hypothetical protein
VHGATWGRTGPHRAAWGLAWGPFKNKNKNPGKKERKRRAAGCYLLRWRWANNPLAHWHCHQNTPSLLIYVLLISPAQ